MDKKRLQKLDAIRGFAALYVLLQHWVPTLSFIPHFVTKTLFSFGQEAVMIFFIISGFTIYFSCHKTPNIKFKDYFLKRFIRIYFPFLITVFLSIFIFYTDGDLTKYFSFSDLVGNFLMLQDNEFLKPGNWFNPFLRNLPLWSLSYEWWFYMMFFPIFSSAIFTSKYRIYIISTFSVVSYLSYLLYPNQAALICSYFIIWWSGVELADIYIHKEKYTFNRIKSIFISLLVMITLTGVTVVVKNDFRLGYYPFLIFRHFGGVFLIILIGWFWYEKKLVFFNFILKRFAIIAPISYGIYIFHYPIIKQWEWLEKNAPNSLVLNLQKIILVFGLAYLVEVKLQAIINRWVIIGEGRRQRAEGRR